MNLKKFLALIALSIGLSASASAQTYLGSWEVDDGPYWGSQPLAYTGLDAAALLFSGITGDSNPNHYAVSTQGSLIANIDHSAWYSILGWPGGTIFAEDYVAPASSQDPGYYYSGNSYPGLATDAASAYVADNAGGSQYTNYAFYLGSVTAPVPEPEVMSMLLAGLGVIGTMARRRRKSMA